MKIFRKSSWIGFGILKALDVCVENETVWLNRQQLALLFNRDIKTVGKHITNALREECQNSVVAKFATTADDGKRRCSTLVLK